MKEMICILCPQGCHLTVDEADDFKVSGNRCKRGIGYGREEAMNPVRTVTSTVCVRSTVHPRCPVKTDQPIPKKDMKEAVRLLDGIQLIPPIRRGDLVVEKILGHAANFVATRDIDQ